MSGYSIKSDSILNTCDDRLVELFHAVEPGYDNQILEGARTEAAQAEKVAQGLSKTMDSKHVVKNPGDKSKAVDAAPYPVIWPNAQTMTRAQYVHAIGRFYHFAGYVKAKAEELGLKIRWGGDWDSDLDFNDQQFDDLDHFELVD